MMNKSSKEDDVETCVAESIGDISIGLVGRGGLRRFGRFGQLVETFQSEAYDFLKVN